MFSVEDLLVKKARCLCIKESDILTTLMTLDHIRRETKLLFMRKMNMEIGTCSDGCGGILWFVEFHMTNRKWHTFIAELKDFGREIVVGETGRFYLK